MADTSAPFDLAHALLRAYETNDRINRYLIENLTDAVWDAPPPDGKGRNIAAIVAHMHNVRLMWLKAVLGKDPARGIPEQLDKDTITRQAAERAFVESHDALWEVLDAALRGGGRVKGFKPDVAGFFAYLVAHDAHHRGQITMLARQLGQPITQKAMFGMWEWNTRAAEVAREAGEPSGARPAVAGKPTVTSAAEVETAKTAKSATTAKAAKTAKGRG